MILGTSMKKDRGFFCAGNFALSISFPVLTDSQSHLMHLQSVNEACIVVVIEHFQVLVKYMLTGPLPNLTGMNSLKLCDNGEHKFRGNFQLLCLAFSSCKLALKNNRINGTLTIGSSHSNQLQLIDLQNNSIEGFTLQADYSVQIILVDNPICSGGSTQSFCSIPQQSNSSYSTPAENCTPLSCTSNRISSPSWKCAYPYTGTLFFRAPSFPTDPNDFAAIQSLKDIWDHVPPNWSGDDPCGDGWSGISCINNRVVSITLASINLSGQLSSDIAKLAELQTLDLSYNEGMTGPLPPAIGNLAKLTSLILVGCGFSGQIPPSIGSLQQLVILAKEELAAISDLEAGSSATEWYSGSDLKNLCVTAAAHCAIREILERLGTRFLSNNMLTGPLPNLTGMNSLNYVIMENTQIQGQLPVTLFSLFQLQTVVSVAFLSSLIHRTRRQLKTARLFPALQIEFPAQAGNVHIPTRGHSFSGLLPFPTDPNDFAAIQSLKDIWDHVPPNWSGDDPCGDGWSGISCINNRVVSITLASINLSGQLSSDIAKLAELQTLDLSYNEGMTGPLPPAIGNLAKLTSLYPLHRISATAGIPMILAKEELAAISDLEAGSSATEWYSGSDLK
ncbi:UNVERIFIED_CONTAM: putative leucine-rich repeat receptor-like protein kinase, partial [Sesamum latifolium]